LVNIKIALKILVTTNKEVALEEWGDLQTFKTSKVEFQNQGNRASRCEAISVVITLIYLQIFMVKMCLDNQVLLNLYKPITHYLICRRNMGLFQTVLK
jgi:hypothetical protein